MRDIARTINGYGITYIKGDFFGTWGGAVRLRAGMSILRDTLDDRILIRPCSTALNTQLGFAAEIGIARDIGNATGNWEDMRGFTMEVASKWFMHRRFWVNSGGCLIVGDPQETLGEAIGRTTLLALTGGAVLLSDNLPSLEQQPERLKLVPLCLPPSGIAARPVDLFRAHEPGREYPRIWHLHAEKDGRSWEVIGLFNWSDEPVRETIHWTDLGLNDDDECLVFDFWTGTLAGRFTKACTVTIPSGAARCLRLQRTPVYPQVAGTDMHVTQGLVDLDYACWNPESRTLAGEAIRAPGAEGRIYIYVPPGYSPEDDSAFDMSDSHCAALTVRFLQAREPWRATFRRTSYRVLPPLNPSASILVIRWRTGRDRHERRFERKYRKEA